MYNNLQIPKMLWFIPGMMRVLSTWPLLALRYSMIISGYLRWCDYLKCKYSWPDLCQHCGEQWSSRDTWDAALTEIQVRLTLPLSVLRCAFGYLEISDMLNLPEMRESGDPLVGVGHGVAASTSSVGGVVIRHLTVVSETVWTGINYRSLQYIYRY